MVKTKLQPQGRPGSEPLSELKLTCMSNLLSATQERVYFKDLLSRFLFVNAGWIAACAPGRAAEDLVGKTDFEVWPSSFIRHAGRSPLIPVTLTAPAQDPS